MSCWPTKITSVTRASRFSRLLIARMTPATDMTRGSLKGWTISWRASASSMESESTVTNRSASRIFLKPCTCAWRLPSLGVRCQLA